MSRSTSVSTLKNSRHAALPPQNGATSPSSSSRPSASPTPVSVPDPTDIHATRSRRSRSSALGQETVPIAPALASCPASIKKKRKKKARLSLIESQEQKGIVKTNDDAIRHQIEELGPREVEEHKSKEEAEEWANREETERQEAEDRAVKDAREAEDHAVKEAREAEDRAVKEAREAEDLAVKEAREAEDCVMWDAREAEATWEARETEDRAVTDAREAEDRAAWEAREAQDCAIWEAREAEDRAMWDAREAEKHEKRRLHLVECAQREAEEKIQREQEQSRKFREPEEKTCRAVGTLADAAFDVRLDLLQEEDEANGVLPTDTVEESLTRTASVSPPAPIPTGLPTTLSEEPFHTGTSLPSPDVSRNSPEWPSPHTAAPTSNSEPALPSALSTALATARHIEDINRIVYPEGIKRPKVELNVNAQKAKFRYDRDFLLQFMNICKESLDNLPLLTVTGKCPGPHNFQITATRNGVPVLHSTLASTLHIEDINGFSNSGGIKNPTDEFSANTRESKFSAGAPPAVTNGSSLPVPYVKSPFAPRASSDRPETRSASFLGVGSGESETPDSSRQLSDGSFLQHGKYFFKDGNVTFLIDGILYCVHRYLFSHESLYFSTRFAELGARDHEALSEIVLLRDVKCEDFEAFLSVLYPHFEEHDLSYEQWRSVLHLSTLWGFASRRKLALGSIQPPTPYDRFLLAREYAVDHWFVPALHALCERTAPLSVEEARGMSVEDIVLVATMREEILRFGVSAVLPRVDAVRAELATRRQL